MRPRARHSYGFPVLCFCQASTCLTSDWIIEECGLERSEKGILIRADSGLRASTVQKPELEIPKHERTPSDENSQQDSGLL
jgi:hypothetical protein